MTILPPTQESIQTATNLLKNGGIVAFATETVYGLGCDTFNEEAIQKIYQTKGRPPQNPMIAHVLDKGWCHQLTGGWNDTCDKLAHLYWPGPLTIVLPKSKAVPRAACGGRETIAIRCPKHPIARQLLAAFGKPISAPSANKTGYISPTTAQHVEDEYGGNIQVIDGGPCENGIESTVISLVGTPTILRLGLITTEALEVVVGIVHKQINTTQSDSPGTTKQHYSPHTKTTLVSEQEMNTINDPMCGTMALIGSPKRSAQNTQMPLAPKEYGELLYATLRELDRVSISHIYIESPPNTLIWEAITDRLIRCSSSP